MESTGVYWIPLFELLSARGFEVRLVDPRQLKHGPGRKTDVLDCPWIQQLHTFGLLAAAFRPEDQICVLRSYLRQRAMLVTYASHHIQHMQKALEQMNVKLAHVGSDITGVTCLAIIRAILGGQRDPRTLATLRDPRCKTDAATIARSLGGNWRSEHLFELRQALELVEFYQTQIGACDHEIEAQLLRFEDKSGGQVLADASRPRKARRTAPRLDVREHLHRLTGVDLTRIDGIDAPTALKVVAEIGLDMTRWPIEKHFASWLSLAPGSKVTGGKQLSGRTKPSASRAAAALRLSASSLYHSRSALGAFHRRMKARLGAPKAITATAHKLARLIYRMLRFGSNYVDVGQDSYERRYRRRVVSNLTRRARELGYTLVKQEDLSAPNLLA
jgi:transposase